MKTKIALLIIAFHLPMIVSAQTLPAWHFLGLTGEEIDVYIRIENDSTSIKEAWVKFKIPLKTEQNKYNSVIKNSGGYTLGFWTVDCSNDTYSISSRITFNKYGEILHHGRCEDEPRNEKIEINSISEAVSNYICKANK